MIEHVASGSNVIADILTRWTQRYRNERRAMKTICSLPDAASQVIPTADQVLWPDLITIRKSQDDTRRYRTGFNLNPETQVWENVGRIWIPEADLELQLKVLVASHYGTIGHRGIEATRSILRENFFWENMDQDVEQLVKGCIHCLLVRSGDIVPRPLAHALHGDRPNEVNQFDFLCMGKSNDGKCYVLLIPDIHSGYVWLWPTVSTTSEEPVDALIRWIGSFGTMEWFVSDQGSHFKNQLVAQLTSELRVHHHFTTDYSPWANGSVERVCREVLRAAKALCSEWKLAPRDWPEVTECVQSVLNHAPLRRLGLHGRNVSGVYRTPAEVFTSCAYSPFDACSTCSEVQAGSFDR